MPEIREEDMRETIPIPMKPRGGSQKNGLRTHGRRFTDSRRKLEKDGQAGKMAYSSGNSKERWTRRKDCTPPTAGMRESGGCWSS
jgi:hypothetical protein